ncbi:hypothetical protein, partial [Bacillus smithii]|uniref:hypothetical protein n=1 Tax=Bacillus smithii TaxID=1479 RepID=UPI0030C99F21
HKYLTQSNFSDYFCFFDKNGIIKIRWKGNDEKREMTGWQNHVTYEIFKKLRKNNKYSIIKLSY